MHKLRKNQIVKLFVAGLVLVGSSMSSCPVFGGATLNVDESSLLGSENVETNIGVESIPENVEANLEAENVPENVEANLEAENVPENVEANSEAESIPQNDEGVWLIGSAMDLKNFAIKVNNGEISMPADVKLTNNIELNSEEDVKRLKWAQYAYNEVIKEVESSHHGAAQETANAYNKVMREVEDAYYVARNLNLWTPIGTYSKPFSGTFDGGGYTISGLIICSESGWEGIFGICDRIKIDKLNMANTFIYLSEHGYAGGLIGGSKGETKISGCSVEGSISVRSGFAGGLVGQASKDIEIINSEYTDANGEKKRDRSSLIGCAESGVDITNEGIDIGSASVFGTEDETYSVKHTYYTLKDGQFAISEEEISECKFGDVVYPEEKEGFIYKADKEPNIERDMESGVKILSMKYYDEEAIKVIEKLESDMVKAESNNKMLILGLVIVVIIGVVVILGIRLIRHYRRRNCEEFFGEFGKYL